MSISVTHNPVTHSADARIVETLRKGLFGLKAVYRYGSAGTVHERVGSDIDLAVLTGEPLELATRLRLADQSPLRFHRRAKSKSMVHLPKSKRCRSSVKSPSFW
jgi:predicted nucleotidyltransferase